MLLCLLAVRLEEDVIHVWQIYRRSGDPLDPDGDLKTIADLKHVLAMEGDLLFVVPIGRTAKIRFQRP